MPVKLTAKISSESFHFSETQRKCVSSDWSQLASELDIESVTSKLVCRSQLVTFSVSQWLVNLSLPSAVREVEVCAVL
jgi:hypothetical protein